MFSWGSTRGINPEFCALFITGCGFAPRFCYQGVPQERGSDLTQHTEIATLSGVIMGKCDINPQISEKKYTLIAKLWAKTDIGDEKRTVFWVNPPRGTPTKNRFPPQPTPFCLSKSRNSEHFPTKPLQKRLPRTSRPLGPGFDSRSGHFLRFC